MTLAKTHDASGDPVSAGDSVTFSLVAANAGPSDAVGPITVVDTLPAGMTYLSSQGPWDCVPAGQLVTCDLDTMVGGASRTVYLSLSDPDSDDVDPAPASRLVTVHGTDRYNLGLSLDQSTENDQAPYTVTRG